MKLFRHLSSIMVAFIFLGILMGCGNNSYPAGPVTATATFPRIIEKSKKDKRYIIMYSGVNVYNVVGVQVNKSKENMTVQLDRVDSMQRSANKAADTVGYRNAKTYVYMKDSTSYTLDEPHTIPLANVSRIELKN